MKRLFWKSLSKNRVDYGLVILCGVFIVAVIYITAFISDGMIQITTGERGEASEVYVNLGVFLLTYVILGILMVLMLLSYIRKRSYEYAMFEILGMKKKHRGRFIGCEYGGIVLCSMTGGIILGRLAGSVILPVLRLLLKDDSLEISRSPVPFGLTMFIGALIFGLAFIICDAVISCLGIDAVLSMGKGSGRKYRFSPVLISFGIVFAAASVMIQFSYWGKLNGAIPAALASVGLGCLMISGCGIWLEKIRKGSGYYREILWMEQWYHQFYYRVSFAVVLAVFLMVNIFGFGIQICNHVPLLGEENYPYDLVWMANETDESFICDLEKRYGTEITTHSCVRVTTSDFGEHMGISASAYESLTGEKVELAGHEIYVVYQRNREERSQLGIGYGFARPRMYIGSARSDLWIYSGAGLIPSSAFQREYQVVGETNRVVTGVYQSRAAGNWKGNVWEQVIVFSDANFQEIKGTAEGADLAVMIRFPENFPEEDYEKLASEIYAYAGEHSQVNFLDDQHGNLIYEKEIEWSKNQQEQILRLSAAGINMLILMLCMICTLCLEGKSNYEKMRWKYQFYAYSGMEPVKQRTCVRKELFLTFIISILGGLPAAWILTTADIVEKKFDAGWNGRYLAELLGISGVIAGMLALAEGIFVAGIMRKILKDTEES